MRPPITALERLLVAGPQGTGKTRNILKIAARCPDDTFWVIDTDDSYPRMMEEGLRRGELPELPNVHILDVPSEEPTWASAEFPDFTKALKELRSEVSRDDWLVMDQGAPTWDAVQDYFTERVFDSNIEEYFLEVRIEKEKAKKKKGADSKSLGAFEGWMDWPVINKLYRVLHKEITTWPSHVYMTAEVTQVSKEDDRDDRKTFGPYGVKPRGQKRWPYIVQTVLLTAKKRAGVYTLTTVKDRERPELEDEEFEDFAVDYMMEVAGWQEENGTGSAKRKSSTGPGSSGGSTRRRASGPSEESSTSGGKKSVKRRRGG